MSLLNRRRTLMIPTKTEWDIIWNPYTMGSLEDNGFAKLINGKAKTNLTDEGFYLTSLGGYVRYRCPILTCSKGIVEAQINIKSFAINSGFRLALSNGTKGSQICIHSGNLYVLKENEDIGLHPTFSVPINNCTIYLIRMEFDINSGTKVWLDNELIYDMPNFSDKYCSANALFQQTHGETVLKSLKYKFG